MAQCIGRRKDGEQCGAASVRGTELCAGHSGLGVAAPQAEALRAAGVVARVEAVSERVAERKKTLLDRLAESIERNAAEIERGFLKAGRGGDWRAYEALITRVHGKPQERVAVQTEADPLGVRAMSREERTALLARVIEEHPELAALLPGGTPAVHLVKQTG